MLKFYFSGAPNPTKVALFLEEAGIPFEAIPVDTRKGEQHKPLSNYPQLRNYQVKTGATHN